MCCHVFAPPDQEDEIDRRHAFRTYLRDVPAERFGSMVERVSKSGLALAAKQRPRSLFPPPCKQLAPALLRAIPANQDVVNSEKSALEGQRDEDIDAVRRDGLIEREEKGAMVFSAQD